MGGYHYPGTHGTSRKDSIDKGTHPRAPGPRAGTTGISHQHIHPHHHSPYKHHGTHKPLVSASQLTLSAKGIDLLKGIETLRLKPYDDQTNKDITAWVKGATIGYGHLIPQAEWNTHKNGITEANALTLFNSEIAPFGTLVGTSITVPLTQNEFDALVILAFNIGASGFAGSSVVKMINNPKAKTSYATLEAAWKSWNKSQGKHMKGLDNRRTAEWNIYKDGIYKKW